MIIKTQKKLSLLVTLAITILLVLSGCGSQKTGNSSELEVKKEKVVVATVGMPKPFTYVNEENELVGYDIDVARAVFSELPQYEVTFEKTEFSSLMGGLDSGRYQLVANKIEMNEARKEKYIFSNPIFNNEYVIVVSEDRNDINSFNDLLGKKSEVVAGTNFTTALESYNKQYTDNPINLTYTEADFLPIYQNVESGKTDFQLAEATTAETYINEFGLKLKTISLTEEESNQIGTGHNYFMLSKSSNNAEQFANDVNEALDKLIADGTIGEISKKYFGKDYSPKQ